MEKDVIFNSFQGLFVIWVDLPSHLVFSLMEDFSFPENSSAKLYILQFLYASKLEVLYCICPREDLGLSPLFFPHSITKEGQGSEKHLRLLISCS